jgi:hypothetical protein
MQMKTYRDTEGREIHEAVIVSGPIFDGYCRFGAVLVASAGNRQLRHPFAIEGAVTVEDAFAMHDEAFAAAAKVVQAEIDRQASKIVVPGGRGGRRG